MISRWWPWGRAKQRAVEQAPASSAANTNAALPKAPANASELFFERLTRESPPQTPVPPEEEPRITTLVLRVVDYVARKKVDPPVMPALVPRVLALVNEPEVDIARLSQLIEQDLAISAKLLSVANSAAFGGNIEIRSVRKAISHLGTEQVAQVAIGLACSSTYDAGPGSEAPMKARWARLFQHGMTTAFAASYLAGQRDKSEQEAAFLGGLFHDVGQAVALRAVEAIAATAPLEVSELAIDEALHRIHAYPGDEFYKKWTLPESLMTICAQHHQLEELHDEPRVLHYVSLASSFDALLAGSPTEQRNALAQAHISADRLALSEAELEAALTQTRAFGARSRRMFAT